MENNEILKAHLNLKNHALYEKINDLENLKIFMQYHVFAVWDFMSLLKSLQKEITCVSIPWQDSSYDPKLVRLINEIVLAEESDLTEDGKTLSHFSLYLRAMDEIGADSSIIQAFLNNFDLDLLPSDLKSPVSFHLDIALNAPVHEVASSFFYGREKLIPDMFSSIVEIVEKNKLNCPSLIYYFKRHIELDGDEHGPMAMQCLDGLIDSDHKKNEVHSVALKSLEKRNELWNFILSKINQKDAYVSL